jgi:hypothetical protein
MELVYWHSVFLKALSANYKMRVILVNQGKSRGGEKFTQASRLSPALDISLMSKPARIGRAKSLCWRVINLTTWAWLGAMLAAAWRRASAREKCYRIKKDDEDVIFLCRVPPKIIAYQQHASALCISTVAGLTGSPSTSMKHHAPVAVGALTRPPLPRAPLLQPLTRLPWRLATSKSSGRLTSPLRILPIAA